MLGLEVLVLVLGCLVLGLECLVLVLEGQVLVNITVIQLLTDLNQIWWNDEFGRRTKDQPIRFWADLDPGLDTGSIFPFF